LTDISFLDLKLILIPIVFLTLFALFSFKNIFFYFFGNIFEIIPQIKSYIKGSTIMGQSFGVLILPIICLIPFLPETAQTHLLNIGCGAFIIMYIIQIGRGIKIILKETLSLYYIFLYLCGLEILSLLVIIKTIFDQIY
jgi:hypothetical protein